MDELEMALRSDEVDPKLLENLGWNLEQAWQFVEDYKRQVGGTQRQTDRTALPGRQGALPSRPGGPANVRRATGSPTTDARALGTIHTPDADQVNQLREAARQRVPRQLDPILRGYNSSLTSRPVP